MAQWWRICLLKQETQVPSLIQEYPTCHGGTKPMRQNYWSCALELQVLSPCASTTEACVCYRLCSATREATTMRSPHTTTREQFCSPHLEKTPRSNKDPVQPKKKEIADNKSTLSATTKWKGSHKTLWFFCPANEYCKT